MDTKGRKYRFIGAIAYQAHRIHDIIVMQQ